MSVLQLPEGTKLAISRRMHRCLWQKSEYTGYCISSLYSSMQRGVGVMDLLVFNEALLLKHLHKFSIAERSLGLTLFDTPTMTVWSLIPFGGEIIKLVSKFRSFALCQVKDGKTALFWKDNWCEGLLGHCFPNCFSFSRMFRSERFLVQRIR